MSTSPFLLIMAAWLLASQSLAAVEIEKIAEEPKGSVIHLKTDSGSPGLKPLVTPLYAVKELAFLASSDGGTPHLLVTGLPCKDCQEKVVLMLPVGGARPFQFVYPGKIFDPKTRATLFESRAFYGKCLSGNTQDVYVVFQKERVDRRRSLQESVFIAEPGKEYIKEKLIEKRRDMPRVHATLARVKTKLCQELEGRTRPMLKKPLDLTPRSGSADDDDKEQDDAPKENQTQDELPSIKDREDAPSAGGQEPVPSPGL